MFTITGDAHTVAGFKAGQYIRRIRNPQKKEYAHAYLNHLLQGRRGAALGWGTLSSTAAQGVRKQLDLIFAEVEPDTSESRQPAMSP